MNLGRRAFVCGVTAAGIACLADAALAFGGPPGSTTGQEPVDDWSVWLVVDADGRITLHHKVTDLGQGTPASFACIVAQQLGVAPERITLEQAPVREPFLTKDDYYGTAASAGIRTNFTSLRRLGATARSLLVQAAALRWNVAAVECDVQGGTVVHRRSGRSAGFAELADVAAGLPLPSEVQVDERRTPTAASHIGRRVDELAFLDGSAVFGVDVRLPGLSTAAIVHCPIPGGSVQSIDATAALRRKGVVEVVRLDDAVAVVADDYWTASEALRAVHIMWTPPTALPDTENHRHSLLAAVTAGHGTLVPASPERSSAELRRATEHDLSAAHRRLEATFYVPCAAHMTMEPQTATADVAEGRAELWLPTQSQGLIRSTIAELLKLPEQSVKVNTTCVGGSFGRRLETDVVREAALISQHARRPVKLIWSREQDLQNDFFRPAAAARLRAGLTAKGDVSSLAIDVAAPSILASSSNTHVLPADEPDFTAIMGLDVDYKLPTPSISWTRVEGALRSGWWRSVGCSANCFFVESFIDELAGVNGTHPLAYRRALLAHDVRAVRLLQMLEDRVAVSAPDSRDWFWGYSWLHHNGSRVAQAVALSRHGARGIKLQRIVVAVDCGVVVNPHFARSQIVGGVVWGLSACRFDSVTFAQGRPQQSNFHDYRVARARDVPPIDVVFSDSEADPGGLGEESVPGTAPALANAIFAATGLRLRELPFSSKAVQFVD